MEFRYRAVNEDRPPPVTDTAPFQSVNPVFSFFSALPIPGCNIGPSEDYVQFQREIEKEQIRQEIIAAETARRRELIAEVVQEMAIEREMAISRVAEIKVMSLEEKLTMWINQRYQNQNNILFRQKCTSGGPLMYTGSYSLVTSPMTQLPLLQQMPNVTGAKAFTSRMMQLPLLQQMPNATGAKAIPLLESNKEKLIVLDRPDSTEAKSEAEDTQSGLERAKRKADDVQPFQRKRLKSKQRALETRNRTEETGETAASKLQCLGKLGNGKQVETVESKPKSKFNFWCDVCSVGAFCQTVMRSHELGKKHKAAIEHQNKPPETTASTSFITAPAAVTTTNATVSAITVPRSEAITILENAIVQDKKMDEMLLEREMGKRTEAEKKKKVIIRCEICNTRTYSEEVMETHKLGKKHKALLEKQHRKPLAVLDTNAITVPGRSLNADLGDNGSVDHTNGKAHCLD